jgi:hypothetical protein
MAMNVKSKGRTGFQLNMGGLYSIKGTDLDNAQYIALMLKGETERGKGRALIGFFECNSRRYHISVVGFPNITDFKGEPVSSHSAFGSMIRENREGELNFDMLAYIEVSGRTHENKDYIGVYYSIADAELDVIERAGRGEI